MPLKRGDGRHGRPTYSQAAKIIAKFGGESRLAKAMADAGTPISRITAYRWNYSRPYGADGMVPSSQVDRVQRCARREGIVLTDADWAPDRIDYDVEVAA
jgi:hypothetical protein